MSPYKWTESAVASDMKYKSHNWLKHLYKYIYTQKYRNTRGCKQKYILSAVRPYKAPPSLVLHHRWPRSSTAPGCYNAFINTNTNTTQIQIQYKHKKIDTGANTSSATLSCDNRLRWGAESLVLSNALPIFVVRWTSNSAVMQFFSFECVVFCICSALDKVTVQTLWASANKRRKVISWENLCCTNK